METELGGASAPPQTPPWTRGMVRAWCIAICVHKSATVASSGSACADQPVRHGSSVQQQGLHRP